MLGLRLCAQNSQAPVRLAIVNESTDTAAAADLLTAEFSRNEKVQLLERTEIEKVVREQQLSLNNLDNLKLGHLLGADGLLALQSVPEGTNVFLRLQLVAVKPGVILTDERFGRPAQDAIAWSTKIAGHLESLLPKLSVVAQDAIPLSVVNFHAGVRTTEAAELERQIFFLTVERLVREKRLFVLERKRMQALSEEKEISGAEAEPFWNGRYLLDGAIDRNGFNPDFVTISARLIPPGGNPVVIEVSGRRTNCVEAVNQLAEKVLAALKLEATPAAWNTADEADNFFKEAKWNLEWKIFPLARQAAEAAWALGKHDADCMNLRVRTFMPPPDSGIIYFPPREKPKPEKIDDAIQAARLYLEFSRNLPLDEPKSDTEWYKLGLENLTITTRVLQQFNWSPEAYLPVSDKLRELRGQARAMAALLSRAQSVHDSYFVGDRKVPYDNLSHFMEWPSIYGLKVKGGCLWQETPEDEVALYRELMSSPVFSYLHSAFWLRDADFLRPLPWRQNRLVAWNEVDQKRLPEVWQDFLVELKQSPNILLQMEARALQLADTESLSTMLSETSEHDAYRAAYKVYDQELTSAFTNFFDAFVSNRLVFRTNNVDILYLNWGVDDLISRMGGDIVTDTKDALQNRYREYGAKLAAKDKEIAQAVAAAKDLETFAQQKEYLQTKQTYDHMTFAQLFIFDFKNYSREQALEIQPLLENYKKNLPEFQAQLARPWVGQVEANIERILNPKAAAPSTPNRIAMTNGTSARPPGANYPIAGPAGTVRQFNPARTSPNPPAKTVDENPGLEPLVSSNIVTVKSFYPIPTDGLQGNRPGDLTITDHQWIEGKLLLDFQYGAMVYTFDQNGNWKSTASKTYFGVALFDPVSSHWQVAVLPDFYTIETGTRFLHHSTVWRGALYSSNNGKVQKFDSEGNTWRTTTLPVSGNCQLYNLGGKLYAADYDSIQQVSEDGRGTKLLASIQRRPAVTSLDSQGALMNLALFTDAQNILCAAVHNKVYRWDGADWREFGGAPASYEPSVFEGGILFLTDDWNMRPARISCLDLQSNSIEACLLSPGADASPKPLWKIPKELSLPNLSAAYWQSDLFLMADHSDKQDTVGEERGTRKDGSLEVIHIITGAKFLPKEGYDSALYCFSRGRAAAEKVRLKFESPEGCPPMAGLGSSSQPLIPMLGFTKGWMLFTPKFLLCGRERLGDIPFGSGVGDFKPGIWVVPLDSITAEVQSLKQTKPHKNAGD
jgi:hypothetical protein